MRFDRRGRKSGKMGFIGINFFVGNKGQFGTVKLQPRRDLAVGYDKDMAHPRRVHFETP